MNWNLVLLIVLLVAAVAVGSAVGTILTRLMTRETAERRTALGRHPASRPRTSRSAGRPLTFIPRPRLGGPNNPRKDGR